MTSSNLAPERHGATGGTPKSGTFGERPAGTGLGAAAGGAVAGGLARRGITDTIDTAGEEGCWRDTFSSRPYVKVATSFEDYGPAYRFGVHSYARLGDHSFEHAEPELEREWKWATGGSQLSWASAKHATRDAWQRVSDAIERATPGDLDRDGK